MTPRYQIARPEEIDPVDCPCGETRRAFADDAEGAASLHLVEISADARVHYHKRLTEIYYVLKGEGAMELDGELHPVRAGDAVLVKPLCRHRALGDLRVLVMPTPAFDPADEWFD